MLGFAETKILGSGNSFGNALELEITMPQINRLGPHKIEDEQRANWDFCNYNKLQRYNYYNRLWRLNRYTMNDYRIDCKKFNVFL